MVVFLAAGHGQARCLGNGPEPPRFLIPLNSASTLIQVQQALKAKGLYQGETQGQADEASKAAIKAFQGKNRLFADGEVSEALLALLIYQPQAEADSLFAQAGQARGNFKPAQLSDAQQINQTDAHGWTPLHYASLTGSVQRVASLLKAGAEVDAASHYGTTPLMLAVRMNRPAVLTELFKHWPWLDQRDYQGEIAEEIAFRQNRNGLLNRFRRQRYAMLDARLPRLPPFRLRMVTWDDQECYVARKSRLPVDCDVQPDCRLQRNQVVLCDAKGERHLQRIAQVVRKTWGGRPEIVDGRSQDGEAPLGCGPEDVMLIGVRH
ncbi:MAG: ankyrin repeat domain-containing protein [Gammaproteobacteria bacterium SHHR-1]